MKLHIENAACAVIGALMLASPFVIGFIRTGGFQ